MNALEMAHDLDLKIAEKKVPYEDEIESFCKKLRELSIEELNHEEIIELYHTIRFISSHIENYLTNYSEALPLMRLFLVVGKLDGYLSALIFKKEKGDFQENRVIPPTKNHLPVPDNSEYAEKLIIKDCLLLQTNEE